MGLTLGCGMMGGSSGGTNSGGSNSSGGAAGSNVSNTAIAGSTDTGIPDCDRLFAKIEELASDKNTEASFIERAAYGLLKDQIMKPIRDEIANTSQADRDDIGGKCREAMVSIDKEQTKDANTAK